MVNFPEEKIRSAKNADQVVVEFTSIIKRILARHAPVVTTMALGIIELRQKEKSQEEFFKHYDFGNFLDRFYTSRIGIRMLMQQHIEMFDANEGNQAPKGWVGVIDPKCDPSAVAADAAENAKFLCYQTYGTSPDFDIKVYNGDRSKDEENYGFSFFIVVCSVTFSYVPSFLYHVVFELVKNSMRAVVETHKDAVRLPPIKMILVEGEEDCTIKISDEGGGIKRSGMPHIFSYMYSTATPPNKNLDPSDMNGAPLAGFGYGLPLSRLYARYLDGDLKIMSQEGYGTDALIELKRATHQAIEKLPHYSAKM